MFRQSPCRAIFSNGRRHADASFAGQHDTFLNVSGIAAVVGVENATKLIKNGDLVRVHGDKGYVEVLTSPHG
jgi:phosphoenolpyruvate synthase/pyruvate phosphate dikinase